jgi:hypothetical protein
MEEKQITKALLSDLFEKILKILAEYHSFGFDDGFNCYFCNKKTFGTINTTCDHDPDCLWLKLEKLIFELEKL